jgi:hypothetical protein
MSIIEKKMFTPIRKYEGRENEFGSGSVEEAKIERIHYQRKEIVVIIFLYVLIVMFVLLFSVYIYMLFIGHEAASKVLGGIQYIGAALFGYLLGYQKEK